MSDPVSVAIADELRELAKRFESMPPVIPESDFWAGSRFGHTDCAEVLRKRADALIAALNKEAE